MNKHLLTTLALFAFAFCASAQTPAWQQKIAPELQLRFGQEKSCDLFVIFRERADLGGARFVHGKTAKARFVYQRLVETAARTQAGALRLLREREAFANSFYLVNAIAVRRADAALAEALARLPEVARLAPDPDIVFQQPEPDIAPVSGRSAVEWGVERIDAPGVWALGYTGQGITIGGADTGYDWEHPALKPHYRGWDKQEGAARHDYNWHDAIHEISPLSGDSIPDPSNNPCGINAAQPCDDFGHGTHTMGTMAGDDGQGNQIGVAPGAKWIACRNMERGNGKPSTYIECFQWFLAPTDGADLNPDPDRAPHVINNSWYCSFGEGCTDLDVDDLLRQAVVALRASGVVVVVSAGNNGFAGCGSANGPPGYFEESFSVGATLVNDTIVGFSSRGPVLIDSSFRTKPNVVAPGVNIRSSFPNNNYGLSSGTSMAGPHVAGLVALVLSARPDLAGEVDLIEDVVEQTAVPKFTDVDCFDNGGQNYPNNTYGYGLVNALQAVKKALTLPGPLGAPEADAPQVSLFPNPVSEYAIFDIKNSRGHTVLELFDAGGRRVYRQAWAVPDERVTVPVKDAPAGVYFWELRAENGTARGKLVVD